MATQRGGPILCQVEAEFGEAAAAVDDNGIGSDDARFAQDFDPLRQEDSNFVAENQGVGLGLTIARPCVETQGGQIGIKRAVERGTNFRIALPPAESDVAASPCAAVS